MNHSFLKFPTMNTSNFKLFFSLLLGTLPWAQAQFNPMKFAGPFEGQAEDAAKAGFDMNPTKSNIPFDRPGPSKASEAADMQKPGFENFKTKVIGTLTNDGMKTDSYLAKVWRRANFKVDAAVAIIKKAVARRAELKMDGITSENFAVDLAKIDYKETEHDKLNRPILYIHGGKTSLKAELGDSEARSLEVLRAFMYTYQRSVDRALQNPEHPQFFYIINYEGWSVSEGACKPCLDIARKLADDFETMFPGFAFRAALINTDLTFNVLHEVIKLALHKDNKDNIYTFMSDRQWRPVLKKMIDEAVIDKLVS